MATLKNTTVDDTGFLRVPNGTAAQRPGTPAAGMIRLNIGAGDASGGAARARGLAARLEHDEYSPTPISY